MTSPTTSPLAKDILIDVRTPDEFSTGFLRNSRGPAINVEYQSIQNLREICGALNVSVDQGDRITLYCRSGRRSNIALQRLRESGFTNVRDIGGFEAAREVLERERESSVDMDVNTENVSTESTPAGVRRNVDASYDALLAGLQEADHA